MKVLRKVPGLRSDSDAFDRMWHLINECRATTTTIKVGVEDLMNLLMDHAAVLGTVVEGD